MKDENIKKAIEEIKLDEVSKTRIFNKIQIDIKEKERGKTMKMNYKVLGSAVVAFALIFTFMYTNKDINQTSPDLGIGSTSEQVSEKLAIIGKIDSIEKIEGVEGKEGDIIAKVSGELQEDAIYEEVSVHVHASTNIFNEADENLYEIGDLKEGQKVKVYYSGTEGETGVGQISGMRVVILD